MKFEEEIELANTISLSELLIDDSPEEIANCSYTLSSLVQHYGSMHDGHYVADIKSLQKVNTILKDNRRI